MGERGTEMLRVRYSERETVRYSEREGVRDWNSEIQWERVGERDWKSESEQDRGGEIEIERVIDWELVRERVRVNERERLQNESVVEESKATHSNTRKLCNVSSTVDLSHSQASVDSCWQQNVRLFKRVLKYTSNSWIFYCLFFLVLRIRFFMAKEKKV